MAVERVKEFTIDLGEIVKARLDAFVSARKRVQAVREANYQRRIIDEDLSFQDQVDYYSALLKEERGKIYPDVNYIEKLETTISSTKKLVRARKYRDDYFAFLQDMASGKKSLEDHLEFLQDAYEETWDTDIRDEIQEQMIKVTEAKREQDRKIIDSQIQFNQKDRTTQSLNEAIQLVKDQLGKPEIQRDLTLLNSYQQQLRTLEKEKLEVKIEDKLNWMVIEKSSTERTNPSLWKLGVFAGFKNKGGVEMPVNIGGVRYNSEKEFWQTTLNNYIQSDFANEYAKENKNEANLMWNKLGILSDSYLQSLVNKNQVLRTNPELQPFQQIISSAIQDSVSNALSLKSKDLTAKYYLDKPDIATEGDYEKAKQELENLKILFGTDYSLSPEIQQIETKLIEKRVKTTEKILKRAAEYAEAEGITTEEAIKKYGPTAAVEMPAETFKEKEPMEIASETVEKGKKAPESYAQREKLRKKAEELKKQIEEAEKKVKSKKEEVKQKEKGITPTPAPGPTPAPISKTVTVQRGETLWGIAKRELGAGYRWKELKTPEGKTFTEKTARRLQIGQKLIIPPK